MGLNKQKYTQHILLKHVRGDAGGDISNIIEVTSVWNIVRL